MCEVSVDYHSRMVRGGGGGGGKGKVDGEETGWRQKEELEEPCNCPVKES